MMFRSCCDKRLRVHLNGRDCITMSRIVCLLGSTYCACRDAWLVNAADDLVEADAATAVRADNSPAGEHPVSFGPDSQCTSFNHLSLAISSCGHYRHACLLV